MTRFRDGFFGACAEAGIDIRDATSVLKFAQRLDSRPDIPWTEEALAARSAANRARHLSDPGVRAGVGKLNALMQGGLVAGALAAHAIPPPISRVLSGRVAGRTPIPPVGATNTPPAQPITNAVRAAMRSGKLQ